MSKTALQQVIDDMNKYSWGHYNPVAVIERHLLAERNQIEDAFLAGKMLILDEEADPTVTTSDYFTKTYDK